MLDWSWALGRGRKRVSLSVCWTALLPFYPSAPETVIKNALIVSKESWDWFVDDVQTTNFGEFLCFFPSFWVFEVHLNHLYSFAFELWKPRDISFKTNKQKSESWNFSVMVRRQRAGFRKNSQYCRRHNKITRLGSPAVLPLLFSASAAFLACVGRLLHRIDFYGVIYSEQEFCLLCTCNAPHMHYYRNNLIQSAWDFKHRSQKNIWPKKNLRFCAPSAGSGRAGDVHQLECHWFSSSFPQFTPGSCLIQHWWVFAGRTRCFPVSAPAAASQDMDRAWIRKGWRLCGGELCHSKAMVLYLEGVADARFKVLPIVSSSPPVYSHFQA